MRCSLLTVHCSLRIAYEKTSPKGGFFIFMSGGLFRNWGEAH
jgi:hypothetical protein